jgi:hypothetical protein
MPSVFPHFLAAGACIVFQALAVGTPFPDLYLLPEPS